MDAMYFLFCNINHIKRSNLLFVMFVSFFSYQILLILI